MVGASPDHPIDSLTGVSKYLKIEWSGGSVSGRMAGTGEIGVLLAHGAGTNQDHPVMIGLRDGLAAAGVSVMTFNYPYSETGKGRPDPTPRLLECHRAARDHLTMLMGGPVVLAGRSMGGRMGSYLAASDEPCRALVVYAYPLHPAGQPDKLRADHLGAITVPALFFQGRRDALSRMDLFDRYVRPLPSMTVEVLEANHSLGGLKNVAWLAERTATWLKDL
jgi:predicted alpha/beta-hydrolase family hydrolase